MLTASNQKHARLRMNEWIYISSRMAWVFSKSKVILFTTQQLTFTVACVTFGDVIKYQNNSTKMHKNLHVRKMSACCQLWQNSLVTWFAIWSSFGQKWRKKKKTCRNLKVPSTHSFPCPSSLSSMPHHPHHTSHLIHTPHCHCFSHSFFLPFFIFQSQSDKESVACQASL